MGDRREAAIKMKILFIICRIQSSGFMVRNDKIKDIFKALVI